MKPRSYQLEAVQSIYDYFGYASGNPLIAMPTGTGKSVVIAMFLQSVFHSYPTQRVLILTHVKELIVQNYEKLRAIWSQAPAGIYSAGLNRRETHYNITFGGIASVAKRWKDFGFVDLVIIDEAHLVSPNDETMYQRFLKGLMETNPYLKVIGLTATPWRLGHGKLTDPVHVNGATVPSLFTDICFDITGVEAFNRLIAEGFLSPVVPKATTSKLDVDGVHMRGGEFIPKELQLAVDKHEVTVAAVKEAMESGWNRQHWLVFAAGVDHAIHTAEVLNSMDIPAVAIHSKLSNAERDKAIEGFKNGEYRAAVNNNVLTTGFDFPAIDLIVCLRPTASTVLWVQMLGRGTRPCEGKDNCLVLDFAGNTKRLGPINDPVLPRRKGEKGGEAPVKECPVCHTYVHAGKKFCDGIMPDGKDCKHEFTFQTKFTQGASSGQLIKGDLPIVEVFDVDHVTYAIHTKAGRPPMLKVSYYCGYRMFNEYVCPEHPDYAGRKARIWWKERSSMEMPTSTLAALDLSGTLKTPTQLRIWINKKYPEILAFCYDGTAFGAKGKIDAALPTQIQTTEPVECPF